MNSWGYGRGNGGPGGVREITTFTGSEWLSESPLFLQASPCIHLISVCCSESTLQAFESPEKDVGTWGRNGVLSISSSAHRSLEWWRARVGSQHKSREDEKKAWTSDCTSTVDHTTLEFIAEQRKGRECACFFPFPKQVLMERESGKCRCLGPGLSFGMAVLPSWIFVPKRNTL